MNFRIKGRYQIAKVWLIEDQMTDEKDATTLPIALLKNSRDYMEWIIREAIKQEVSDL